MANPPPGIIEVIITIKGDDYLDSTTASTATGVQTFPGYAKVHFKGRNKMLVVYHRKPDESAKLVIKNLSANHWEAIYVGVGDRSRILFDRKRDAPIFCCRAKSTLLRQPEKPHSRHPTPPWPEYRSTSDFRLNLIVEAMRFIH